MFSFSKKKGIATSTLLFARHVSVSTLYPLHSPTQKRNLNILLQDDLCATNQNGGSQYQQLYQGEWSKIVDCV